MPVLTQGQFEKQYQYVLDIKDQINNGPGLLPIDINENKLKDSISNIWEFSIKDPEKAENWLKGINQDYTGSQTLVENCNAIQSVCSKNVVVEIPSSLLELKNIILSLKSKGKKIKAVGKGHSYSTLTQMSEGDCILKLDKIQGKDKTLEGFLNVVNTSQGEPELVYFPVLGGTTIGDLNQLLQSEDLACINLGATNLQSLSGVLSTSTHGSGSKFGPLNEFVKSILLVDGNGTLTRVEPDTIVTTTKYTGDYKFNLDGETFQVRLIRDNTAFNSVLVGLGAFGVVYSVVLEVTAAFNLYEERTFMNWEDVKIQVFNTPSLLDKMRHVEIYLNPFDSCDKNKRCILGVRRNTTPEEDASINSQGNERDPIFTWGGRHKNIVKATYHIFSLLAKLGWKKFACGLINQSMSSLVDKPGKGNGYIDHSYNVLNANLGQFELLASGGEFCIPFNESVEFIESLMSIISSINKKDDYPFIHVPMGIRFVKASSAFLSMMNGNPGQLFCTVEMPCLTIDHGNRDKYNFDRAAILEVQKKVLAKFLNVKMHWGLCYTDEESGFPFKTYLNNRYANSFSSWNNSRKEFDPDGVFLSPLLEKML